MKLITKPRAFLIIITTLAAAAAAQAAGQSLPPPVCEVVVYDEQGELEDAQLEVDLARSSFAAYERVFAMIQGLWEARTIPYMDYLKAKYDRDAARLKLEKADLILERQSALVEQYRLVCGSPGGGGGTKDVAGEIRKAFLHYRQSDCGSLAKSIEVAENNLEYNREYLKQIHKLREGKVATNTQVVLAELQVELEEKNLADAKRRTKACRAGLTADAKASNSQNGWLRLEP